MIPPFIYFVGAVCGLASLVPITWIGGVLIFAWMERMVSSIGEKWRL